MKPFIIPAPLHNAGHSNGIFYAIRLAKAIESLGYKAYFIVLVSEYPEREHLLTTSLEEYLLENTSAQGEVDPEAKRVADGVKAAVKKYDLSLLEDFSQQFIDNAYVIYGERIIENPLNARNVVRMFLNKNGFLNGGKMAVVGRDDFILAHSRIMHPNPHYILYFAEINPVFNAVGTVSTVHRKFDATYIGKGILYGKCNVIPGSILIERDAPNTKEGLAVLLRNTRFFFTWDSMSSTNAEAVLCGAVPILLRTEPWTLEELDGMEPGPLPKGLMLNHTGTNVDIRDFPQQMERVRERLRFYEDNWVPHVKIFIGMVESHFAKVHSRQLEGAH